ncbi:NosD domain-containing protein, partial [Methanobrevibacter cuticularis]|uniref:NosD domain-containing protein n=1 Tax=Methanobrevibacter cuticularis TaxID=47311 RepID=UPI000A5449C8
MIMKNKNVIAAKFEKNICFPSGTHLRNLVLLTFVFLCFFALLSGVSAANFNSSSTNDEIQNFLSNTTATDNEVVFDAGDYNTITGLNVSRSVNISSNGQVNIKGPNTGTLFNITAPNVKIVNLNMSGYNTAINSNTSNLSVIGCNISTIDRSIHLSGDSLTGVLLENNTIISTVNNNTYGAVYVNATDGSVVKITVKGNNILGNGTTNSMGIRFNVTSCNNTLIFENNNITGTSSQGVGMYAETSNNNIIFTNNNITGTSGSSLYLFAHTNSNNTITFTNNILTGSGHGFALDAYTNCNNTITFTNNNITCTGTSASAVYLYGYTSNNNMTLTNNNITGAFRGVFLDAHTNSNNTMTITNNNITGISNYGVYTNIHNNCSSNITLTNNNITGTTYGVVLSVYNNCSSNITLTNNNIIGTTYGFALDAYTNCNNTITLTNNNITGTSGYGVYMYAHTSNNTITLTNNNIIGTTYGVHLRAETSNNTISFTDNNIKVVSYGIYVNCNNNLSFSGLSVVNNTINATNATGIGIGFVNLNSVDLSDIFVSGNNIFAGTTGGTGINFATGLNSVNNVTINYNRVLAGTGLSIPTMTSGIDANLNWWGANDITGKIMGITTSNHYILNITNSSSLDDVHFGDKLRFYLLVLNTTLDNTGVENLPDFIINGTLNGEDYN